MSRRDLLPIAVLLGLAPTAALADNNFLNIIQDGKTNTGSVVQSGVGNQAGTAILPVHQEGVFDDLVLTQSGDDNNIGLSGQGLVQDGTASTDGTAANNANILQNSNGNSIGELVQTTLGTHPTTGNTLSVTQDKQGQNTIGSIEQVQDDADSANIASITQTGFNNWLDQLSQHTTSGGGANQVSLTLSGDYNGIDSHSLAGAGPLAVLARSTGAATSQIIQANNLSGGAENIADLAITGDYNQFGITQLGTDNLVGETISGDGNSFATYQSGADNQIASGGIVGDGNDLGILQFGTANIASAVLHLSSSDNELGIGQDGTANEADVSLKGNNGIVGVSQSGTGHFASITTTGDKNVLLAMQENDGLTASVGDKMNVNINGDGNNGLNGIAPQSFTGPALQIALGVPAIPRSLLISPDATLLVTTGGAIAQLDPGMLVQWGENNNITVDVGTLHAADDNLFAVMQKGNSNVVVAHVEGTANQFVVVQQHGGDNAAIDQDGANNIAVISQ